MTDAAMWAGEALRSARAEVMWLDDAERPGALDPLRGDTTADLVVVGGGYSGLWTALIAKERDPGRDIVVLEAGECGWQGSGRNGGFLDPSLTHGFSNGLDRWPEELDELDRLGELTVQGIEAAVERYDIDCNLERVGGFDVADQPHQVEELRDLAAAQRIAGHEVVLLEAEAMRARVDSPTYLAGLYDPMVRLVEPARLAWGLRRACLELGVRIHEQTTVRGLERDGSRVLVRSDDGTVLAPRVALGTNAFPPLLRRLRIMTVPVYDYVLATEPLTTAQRRQLGWAGREGVADSANLFHYYRLTRDDRILWGGYDAVYHFGNRIDPALEQSGRTHRLLAEQFFDTFPQLAGEVRFGHRWAGVIDTCTRFAPFFGTALDGKVAYAMGYTGLGVGATRFGAEVMLDLLEGAETERTTLRLVREKPLPFPPEPVRAAGINLTRWSVARADATAGRRNLWLKTLDRLGMGFDS